MKIVKVLLSALFVVAIAAGCPKKAADPVEKDPAKVEDGAKKVDDATKKVDEASKTKDAE